MRLLVTGALGMLGKELVELLKRQPEAIEIVERDIGDLPIEQENVVLRSVREIAPEVIVNCAAYTNVDGCETNRDLAFAVNATGPGNLAKAATACSARFIHISTDFVFDGEKRDPYVESDPPKPLSVYGESKLDGEKQAAAHCRDAAVLRTAWLYGRHGKNFINTMLRLGREKEEITVVADEVGSPTWAADLAGAIWAVVKAGARGIYHATNRGACSRVEQAQKVFDLMGSKTRIKPTTAKEYGLPARRPAHAVLDGAKLARDTGYRMKAWDEALAEYLRSIGAAR